ncbi:MAG: ribonuclease HII [Campylobacterota bacterium]|nr:ribonuclease HII [Campylobacterota bacterium]
MSDSLENLCGIDEAGRGPFAGPLVMAGVLLTNNIDGLNDSKKLTEKKREKLFDIIKENSIYHIVFIDNSTIDKIGLSKSLQNGLIEIMDNIKANNYLFDGNTTFGIDNLKSLIKADAAIPQVSAASVLAKVSRDRYMVEVSNKYPNYSFEKHKGYGTKAHKEAILKYGLCDIHRKSFKIKLTNKINILVD